MKKRLFCKIKFFYTNLKKNLYISSFRYFIKKTFFNSIYIILFKNLANCYYYKKLVYFNNKYLLEFWVEIINIANYLYNKLLIKNQKKKFIFKKSWNNK